MALTATVRHFQIALSDVDRSMYATLDLRPAQHPSETTKYLVTRVLAYCLHFEEGLAFSKGLSTAEEPAVWLREADGRVRLWIDIGRPGAERLHKANKAADRVVVCTTDDPDVLRSAVRGQRIHRPETIEILSIPRRLVEDLDPLVTRSVRWECVHSGGHIYVTAQGNTYEGALIRARLLE